MSIQQCPHRNVRFRDFLYADACPACHEAPECKLDDPPSPIKVAGPQGGPLGGFLGKVRFLKLSDAFTSNPPSRWMPQS
jgi:hypothetical protein